MLRQNHHSSEVPILCNRRLQQSCYKTEHVHGMLLACLMDTLNFWLSMTIKYNDDDNKMNVKLKIKEKAITFLSVGEAAAAATATIPNCQLHQILQKVQVFLA